MFNPKQGILGGINSLKEKNMEMVGGGDAVVNEKPLEVVIIMRKYQHN